MFFPFRPLTNTSGSHKCAEREFPTAPEISAIRILTVRPEFPVIRIQCGRNFPVKKRTTPPSGLSVYSLPLLFCDLCTISAQRREPILPVFRSGRMRAARKSAQKSAAPADIRRSGRPQGGGSLMYLSAK